MRYIKGHGHPDRSWLHATQCDSQALRAGAGIGSTPLQHSRSRPALPLAIAVCVLACSPRSGDLTLGDRQAALPVEIVSCVDLPRGDQRSHSLSGLAWDPVQHRLFAISDNDRRLTVLEPRAGFAAFDLAPSIALDIDVQPWDGEALALADDHFLVVANETLPAILLVDRAGRGATPLALTEYRGIRDNLGIEGIGYTASAQGRFLFFVNEQALEGDGPVSTAEHGTLVRILRRSLDGGAPFEAAYLTDPIFAAGPHSDNGVSDLVALSADRVLLLERAYVEGRGNGIRLYEADLCGAQDIRGLTDARPAIAVRKRLVVDLATVPDDRCSAPVMPQRRRSFDNYEGMALGPTLPDGRQLLFLVSDDNNRDTQLPRILTLAIATTLLSAHRDEVAPAILAGCVPGGSR